MNEDRKSTRKKLKDIASKIEFDSLLSKLKCTNTEREILYSIYIDNKRIIDIAENFGYCERRIKEIHKDLLDLIKQLIT